jgi:hypothetical protein
LLLQDKMVDVQLEWDGVVLPVKGVTMENVRATAKRFAELTVDDDFYVTYKDDEGETISVKNDQDLAEGILWVKEQNKPCLCLRIPYGGASDSDDDGFSLIDPEQASPRDKAMVVLEPSPPPLALDTELEDERDLVIGTHSTEMEEEIQEVPTETRLEVPETHPDYNEEVDEDATEPEEEQPESEEEQPESEEVVEDEVTESQGEVDTLEEAPLTEAPETIVEDSAKKNEVIEAAEEDIDYGEVEETSSLFIPTTSQFIPETSSHTRDTDPFASALELTPIQDVFAPHVLCSPTLFSDGDQAIPRFVELLFTGSTSSVDLKPLLLEICSSTDALQALGLLLSHPAIQTAIVEVSSCEAQQSGSVYATFRTQVVKIVCKHPELFMQIMRIPRYEDVFSAVRAEFEVAAPKTISKIVHSGVTCDGCDSDPALAQISKEAGCRGEGETVLGIRYKSAVFPNFDLCEPCEASGRFQANRGPFLKIVDPTTAPELILCVMPGATHASMNDVQALDWRNPIARDFVAFIEQKRRGAFPPRAAPPPQVAAPVSTPSPVPEPSVPVLSPSTPAVPMTTPVFDRASLRCKHLLTRFETPRGNFSCDICSRNMPTRAVMHGCRECNFDSCDSCFQLNALGLQMPAQVSPPPHVAPTAPPQAKFVSDVTLADGCVVRPNEKLSKTWRVRNSGAERWPAGTRIAHVGGDSLGGPMEGVEVPLAAPGEAVNVTVPLVMPQQPGRYTSYWRMMTPYPQNAKFGHRFWVTVNVVHAPPPPPPRVEPPTLGGMILRPAVNPPPRVSMLPGSPQVPNRAPVRPPPPPPALPAPLDEDPVVPSPLEEAVARITELGFSDIDKIVKILNDVNGDAGAAIDKLLMDN